MVELRKNESYGYSNALWLIRKWGHRKGGISLRGGLSKSFRVRSNTNMIFFLVICGIFSEYLELFIIIVKSFHVFMFCRKPLGMSNL